MALLNIAPTKSSLLALRRQLSFAEEGYDLLEQKRQILVAEMMNRLKRAQEAERRVRDAFQLAFAALRCAALDIGSGAIDRAILAIKMNHRVQVTSQRLMGLRIPRIEANFEPPAACFGIGGTSASADIAMRRFLEALPLLAELAELQTAVVRLSVELRKTQRRCNALTRIVIPNCRQTIAYIADSLEERDREALASLKAIRHRLGASKQ